MNLWCTNPYSSSADASTMETSGIFDVSSSAGRSVGLCTNNQETVSCAPGSTSRTISIASFQKGTIELSPVRLKSSSMKSSATSQKYSWPGKEQNQLIHVKVEVGVEEPTQRSVGYGSERIEGIWTSSRQGALRPRSTQGNSL